jgi:hypothetical protein
MRKGPASILRGKLIVVMLLLYGLVFPFFLSLLLPALPARFDHPGLPFRYVVGLGDTLAMVEQAALEGDWRVLDSAWSQVSPQSVKCPDVEKAGDLIHLQRYSNLENIRLAAAGGNRYRLQASRDDLGGPPVTFLYACDAQGIRPLLRYGSFLGFSYPILGWRYWLAMTGAWVAMTMGIAWILRRKKA